MRDAQRTRGITPSVINHDNLQPNLKAHAAARLTTEVVLPTLLHLIRDLAITRAKKAQLKLCLPRRHDSQFWASDPKAESDRAIAEPFSHVNDTSVGKNNTP